jgi:hypothetical protein
MNIEIKFNPENKDQLHNEKQQGFINDIIGVDDEDVCQEDEYCRCPECQAYMEAEMAYHLRSYRLYCNKDDEGNLIDTRTGEIVCYRA